ncbi:universal stress protein [Rhizobium sp. TH2]|uniref:universal stress protein n=1 Tax=Rhizobium sp. TH2 TaxID=2775403 RepID=UPI00215775DD|nr:universal stress protein [Rhizobium sp. TH2]UVC11429.1 universal stress protein [Rhizobium sp. TH2]
MPVKTIAAILTQAETCRPVFDAAAAIAGEHGAHVIGLHGEVIDPPPVLSPLDLPDSSVISSLYDAAAERTGAIRKVFEDCGARSGVSYEWRPFKGSTGAANAGVIDSVRAADLVIAPQPQAGMVSEHDTVLFEGGRPVLFIPWIDKEFKAFKRVLIAWDGSRGATRSVFDALPLLEKATDIEIFSVQPKERDGQPGDMLSAEIAASLSRHGLNVTTRSQAKEGLPISAVLENRCSDFSADLMIMGAYGTSRIMERIFGGVTHVLLESMTVPVLMSR